MPSPRNSPFDHGTVKDITIANGLIEFRTKQSSSSALVSDVEFFKVLQLTHGLYALVVVTKGAAGTVRIVNRISHASMVRWSRALRTAGVEEDTTPLEQSTPRSALVGRAVLAVMESM